MKEVIVTSQEEWDALSDFSDRTIVNIRIQNGITLEIDNVPGNASARLSGNASARLYGNASARLYGNASAVLYDNASAVLYDNASAVLSGNAAAELYGNSSAELYDNSSAELYDNAAAELYGNASAVLYGNASAVLSGNASAELYGNASARLYGNASARLYGNASAELYGNASARLYGNASAELYGNASARLYGNASARLSGNASAELYGNSSAELYDNAVSRIYSDDSIVNAHHHSIIICQDCTPTVRGNTVIRTEKFIHDLASLTDIYPVNEGSITLFKSVRRDTRCDFRTGKIKYEGRVICPDFDPDTTRQCGGGLHLSPRPEIARRYSDGLILECRVPLKYTDDNGAEQDNIIIYGADITKVRCKVVDVIGVWNGVLK